MLLKTTIRKIYGHRPCSDGFAQLIYSVTGRKESPATNISEQFAMLTEEEKDREIDLIGILESNGIEHAVWALRCFEYRDYCRFLADVAESVLHIFEEKFPEDDRPRKAIQAIRDYRAGKISLNDLDAAAKAAWAAAWAAGGVAGTTVWAAAGTAAGAATRAAARDAGSARAAKWQEIESLFRKHFGGKDENNH